LVLRNKVHESKVTIPDELIINKIYWIRDQKVMLDKDLAKLYDVEMKRLKEQVRRNINRFPENFMFELTAKEHNSLRSHFATLKREKHSKYPPFAFSEYGILMLSSVLNSEKAVKMSLRIIETVVRLGKLASNYDKLLGKIQQMESHNREQIGEIFKVLEQLLATPKEIGSQSSSR
jgi:hypothetical protein